MFFRGRRRLFFANTFLRGGAGTLCAVSFLLLTDFVLAQTPVLDAGVYIQDGVRDLSVITYSAPEVHDWNNDGKKDLLVGEYANGNPGKIKLFLNQGTDVAPVFDGGSFIQIRGVNLSVGST